MWLNNLEPPQYIMIKNLTTFLLKINTLPFIGTISGQVLQE